MRQRTLAAVLLLITVAAAVAAGVWIYLQRSAASAAKTPPTPAATLIGDLINNANYEMRSLELGRWFLNRLRAELRAGRSCGDVDHEAIVARLPGTNAVTRAEQAKHLRALLALACAGPRAPLAMLDEYEAMLAPGTLAYAYPPSSSVALP